MTKFDLLSHPADSKGSDDKVNAHEESSSNKSDVVTSEDHPSKAIKRKQAATADPPTKKLRVKPEKVKEVAENIIKVLTDNYSFGMTELPLDTLCSSVGYKHPRSDAFADAIKLLEKDGIVEKIKKSCRFSDTGIKKFTTEAEPVANPEEARQQFWNQFEGKLKLNKKSSGEKVLSGAKAIWEKLKGGEGYTKKELVAVTDYNMERSTGFEEILKCMTQLGFTQTTKGKVVFTDKMFPFGRP